MSPESAISFAVLIPAYKPSRSLVDLVRALAENDVAAVVVVDDGSGPDYADTFAAVAAFPGVRMLRHATNLGKGAALKTGINCALCTFPGLIGLVTADADGQHDPSDVLAVSRALQAQPEALVLGSRIFRGGVPLRSAFGNIATRGLMRVLLGRKLRDTQTGLRGIPRSLLLNLLKIESAGYEFELEALITAHDLGMNIVEVPIRTIYERDNPSSHFNPLTDSMKIYFVLLRFGSVSLMTAVLDNLIFTLAYRRTGNVLGSQVAGRVFAVTFNYWMVRTSVFYSRRQHAATLPKYLALMLASGSASYGGISYLSAHAAMNPIAAKLLVETLLFFVNFEVQRLLIFKKAREKDTGTAAEQTSPAISLRTLGIVTLGIVFTACVGLLIYGFATARLFDQHIWDSEGIERLARYTGLFVVAAGVILLVVPRIFVRVVLAVIAVLTIIAVGPLALIAPALFLISASALGTKLLNRSEDASTDTQLCATLFGAGVYIFLMSLVARLPVNFPAVWATLLALPIVFDAKGTWRRLRSWASLAASAELRLPAERAASGLLAYVLILHWLVVLKPEVSADGLAMHLAIPADIAYHHALTFDPGRFVWSVMPMGADFAYAIVYLLGGEYASRLLNFAMLLAIVALLYCAVRRWVSPAVAYLLAALFAATPMVQMVTGDLLVENLLAALILAMMTTIWRLGETGERKFLVVAAALGGSALATKFGALAFVAIAAPFAIVEARRHRSLLGRAPLLAVAVLLLTALPSYTIAYVKTGNPLFPFLNDRLPSRLFPPNIDIQDKRFRERLTWATPYRMTFRTTDWYEGQNGAFGFQYLVFVPLALLAIPLVIPKARRRPAVSAAVVALGASLSVLGSQPNARYIYAALPLVSVPFAALIGAMEERHRVLAGSLIAFAAIATAADIYFLPGSSFYHKDLYIQPFLSRAARAEYLEFTAPIRGVIAHFNRTHTGEAVLLPGEESSIAGIQGDIYENHWHQITSLNRLRQARTLPEMLTLMREWRVRNFILPKPTYDIVVHPPVLRELLARCTAPEFEFGNYYEARLLDECGGPRQPTVSVTRGTYDDLDPALVLTGDWTKSNDFGDPWGHTVSYSDVTGSQASFAFEGAGLTYVFTKAPNRGVAAISIDGAESEVDLYSPSIEWRSRVSFSCSPGKHVAAIRVTGRKSAAASGAFVDVDALVVE